MVNNYQQDEAKTKFSWHNFSRIIYYLKPYQKDFIFAVILGIIGSILLLFIPKIIAYAIDNSFVKKDFLEIILLTCIMFIVIVISLFLSKTRRYKIDILLNKVANDLKIDIFEKLQYLPNTYFDTHSHGKIYTRASSYPDDASIILCYVLLEVILDIINLIFVVIFMLMTHVSLSLIGIGFSIILVLFFIFISKYRRELNHKVNDKKANVSAYVSESIYGIRITQSFNREQKNETILQKLEKERLEALKKSFFVSNLDWSLTEIFNLVSMALIYYVGFTYFYPTISLGTILAVDSYTSRFWEPISYLTSSYNEIMEASVYLERIFELLDEPLVIENSKNAQKLNIIGNVELRDVTFYYQEEKTVLEHLNLKINTGEKVGLVGETGCGKSTILSLISRFYDVIEGEVLIDGINIKDIRLDSLRGQVSVMLQDNFLFARSVYDNLVLDKKITKEEVIQICKKLDIHDMILNLEKGYDTILLNNGSNLSSGERQLLCLARIMVQNPKILILDEATSNIDLMTEKKITKVLDMVMQNRTTIMVAHRISTIKKCDKIALIKNKSVYELGTHQELMAKEGEYFKLYTRQSFDNLIS